MTLGVPPSLATQSVAHIVPLFLDGNISFLPENSFSGRFQPFQVRVQWIRPRWGTVLGHLPSRSFWQIWDGCHQGHKSLAGETGLIGLFFLTGWLLRAEATGCTVYGLCLLPASKRKWPQPLWPGELEPRWLLGWNLSQQSWFSAFSFTLAPAATLSWVSLGVQVFSGSMTWPGFLQVEIPQLNRLMRGLLELSCCQSCPFSSTAAAKCFAGLLNKHPAGTGGRINFWCNLEV